MKLLIALIIFAVALIILFLWMIRPGKERRQAPDFSPYEKNYIAHRGLFNNASEAPENSLPASQKAVERGYGLELDVQRTRDGKLVVFHDMEINRMTGGEGKVGRLRYHELQQYNLADSQEKIPLFEDVLKLVAGKVPMIIEIKVGINFLETVRDLAEIMEGYEGEYCVESFNPIALIWYRKVVPQVLRGQLSMNHKNDPTNMPRLAKWALTNLLMNFWAKPDFIAFNHKDQNLLAFQICRKLYKIKTAAWTIKSKEDLENARKMFDIFIFDSFDPEKEERVPQRKVV